ncbi:zinc/manganese transport system ATP-binding protein [Methanomicrobium sp. W14]|jgi:zinc/manganese transport system ATP-binding protein|uniref:metal ABC transporter ATP-binding protein n=1 Tax=Methanomicrobium sp. W14 TaxID=2817839 RepID=UPI001AE126EA|nr:ATP-binding cassette domain-containing protein [Methanomicrobium sp. W14]MBP2134375.1 zinc/manganese transport system ATP-binding protein [Methanomicrobium sp. W14]
MNEKEAECPGQIELSGVYTAYMGAEYPVIRDLSLSIKKGEFVIVGGPNGAGKTTLLETMNGMLPITYGSAKAFGIDVVKNPVEVRKKMGYVVQSFAFDPLTPFTVENVVMMGRYGILGCFKKPAEEDYSLSESAMKMLGLEDLAQKTIGTLSGGQQQKVLIAQNLAKNPGVMLLDEPFSNLDICTREFVSGVLEKISKEGCTVVMVSHAFDALPGGDLRIISMDGGSITLDEHCDSSEVEDKMRKMSGLT